MHAGVNNQPARKRGAVMERHERGPERIGYSERDFKVCDLCGALNPATNTECFVCGWNGRFHTDRETVREMMEQTASEYGGLTESLFVRQVVPSTPPRLGLLAALWNAIRGIFSRE